MLGRLRSFLRRVWQAPPAGQEAFFAKQEELQEALQACLRAYERRLAYLQDRLLAADQAGLQQDAPLFEEAHQALERVLARLRAADQEAESLLREWRDWLAQARMGDTPLQARERLEVLRSELALRGLLPVPEALPSPVLKSVSPRRAISRSKYRPAVLSDDHFGAFDEVLLPRLQAEQAWIDQAWKRALAAADPVPWHGWLAARRKEVYGWKNRLKRTQR